MKSPGVEGHVEADALPLGGPAADPDAGLDDSSDRDIADPQAEHGGQPQAGAKAEHDQRPFPIGH